VLNGLWGNERRVRR